MPDSPRIIDNQAATVADYLRPRLRGAETFDFVSAYFSIYGYALLADELESAGAVRFLFGDPGSVEQLDPGTQEPKFFEAAEEGMAPNEALHQKYLARRCAEWVNRPSVGIRSVKQSNFLHGKLYLTGGPAGGAGLVGSSNFTRRGLGGGGRPNLEINLAVDEAAALDELREWFNRLWNDRRRTEEVKGKVLEALARLGRDYAADRVYYKTLLELFRADIEAMKAGDEAMKAAGFTGSQVWNALFQFQQDGFRSVLAKLQTHGGCILADSVGLGKTYTALAVIKYCELRNERVLVLCPSKLKANWSRYQVNAGNPQNPFPQDRFGYTLLAHTDLSRHSGMSGGVNLGNFQWGSYDLVVIDESHNFRNDGGRRYRRLLEEVIAGGARTKVLMLSATPVNTSLTDLRNQIYLMTEGREDAFRQSLGVGNLRSVMAAAQRQFKEWETGAQAAAGPSTPARQTGAARRGRRDKSRLLESLGADFLRLLDGVSISRSRRQVERFYAAELERIGRFPQHAAPENAYPHTDLEKGLSYQELADGIGRFRLALYQPSDYVTDPARLAELAAARQRQNFNQQDSERFLVGMLRTNFLKRLESSAHSLTLTLQRTIGKIDAVLERIDRYEKRNAASPGELDAGTLAAAEILPDDDEDDEEFFINRGRNPYRLAELDLARWQADLRQDRETLAGALKLVEQVTPERDGKLAKIREAIRQKVEQPTTDNDGQPNRKLLAFTTFKDTAQHLYDNLGGLAKELGVNIAMVSGDETHTSAGVNNFDAILANFAPFAQNRRDAAGAPDIDLLIATDCISEGQNLQDCDLVINYDIHWNPVRIVQRFGRIDRIGSRNKEVRMVNYWPTEDMEAYLRLESRVQARMALADVTATGDEDPFTEADAQMELNFRNEQLLRLREEALTLEELEDAPHLGDFTLGHFITQLLRYLDRSRDELEAMLPGVYAVTPPAGDAAPGVIFCLRQRNAPAPPAGAGAPPDPRRQAASPRHPYYLVYLLADGVIRYGCGSLHQTLSVFEAAAEGRTEPITALCDRFDRETGHGRQMAFYDRLLSIAVSQIAQAYAAAQSQQLRPDGPRDFVLPTAAEVPSRISDFELITWLIMLGPEPPQSEGENGG